MERNRWKQSYGLLRMALEDVRGLKQHPSLKRRRWRGVVREYASLGLTFERNRLRAVTGIASTLFGDQDRGRYLAGLWEDTLHLDLQWVITGPRKTLPSSPLAWLADANSSAGKTDFIAPSWSWASKAEGCPNYDLLVPGDEDSEPEFELIAARCEPLVSAGNEFGRLEDNCFLAVRGELYEIRLQLVGLPALDSNEDAAAHNQGDNDRRRPREVWASIAGEQGGAARVFMDYKLKGEDNNLAELYPSPSPLITESTSCDRVEVVKETPELFYALPITGKCAILLRRVHSEADEYERIGLATKLQTYRNFTHLGKVTFKLL
jgi:hypothetical protein